MPDHLPGLTKSLIITLLALLPALHADIQIEEWLDHDWTNELVLVDLPPALKDAPHLAIEHVDGTRTPAQRVGDQAAVIIDLPAAATYTGKLVAAKTDSTIVVTDTDAIRLDNGLFGITIAKPGTHQQGPISTIRLSSGEWLGTSTLTNAPDITSYTAEIIADGPVFAEALCRYTFADSSSWELRIRLNAGESAAVISEQTTCDIPFIWEWQSTGDWHPDKLIFRHGSNNTKNPNNATLIKPFTNAPFLIMPWVQWWHWQAVSVATVFRGTPGIVYYYDGQQNLPLDKPKADAMKATEEKVNLDEPTGPDFGDSPTIFAGASKGSRWANAGQGQQPITISRAGESVSLKMTNRTPGRFWLLGSCILNDAIAPDVELTLPERTLIKLLETPLQEVREMTLDLPSDDAADYPGIIVRKEDLPAVKRRYPTPSSKSKQPIWNFLFNPTPEIERAMVDSVIASINATTRVWTNHQEGAWADGRAIHRPSPEVYTHHICIRLMKLLFQADLALSSEHMTPAERRRLRGQLAFLGTKMAAPDYYSLERGFKANPNMTTMRYSTVGMLGCLLKDHPLAPDWVKLGTSEINRQLRDWVDDNGGWLECPHYHTLVAEGLVLLRAAHFAGFSDDIYSERLLSTILYLAKISTPPDPRHQQLRHFPPAGNSYRMEVSCIFSVLAKLHQERNPEAANALQWTWYQQGKPLFIAIGGDASTNYFSEFLVADFEPTGPPAWESELFPKVGAMLRSHFPTNRETQLYMLQGVFMQHYDHDRGSFQLWGKGRPLSLDWGYDGRMGPDFHNMLNHHNIGYINHFHTSPHHDYLRSDQRNWTRQIAFAKDTDPEDPAYYLIRDSIDKSRAHSWHFWLYTKEHPKLIKDNVLMTGHHDVDLDIWLPPKFRKQLKFFMPKELAMDAPPPAPHTADDDLDIGMDLALDEPVATNVIKTRQETVTTVQGFPNKAGWDAYVGLTQKGLTLAMPKDSQLTWLLYPRLRNQPPVVVNPLDDDQRVLQVKTHLGTDIHFISEKPFTWKNDTTTFQGTNGLIRQRKGKTTLHLGAPGTLTHHGETITQEPKTP